MSHTIYVTRIYHNFDSEQYIQIFISRTDILVVRFLVWGKQEDPEKNRYMSLAIMTYLFKGRHGHNYMAVRFTTACAISAYDITTKVVRSNPVHGEVYSIQHYVIKFFCDLQQVGGFLRFRSSIKLTTTIQLNYCWKWR